MAAIWLLPDGSRKELQRREPGKPYRYLDLQLSMGMGRMGIQDFYGFRMFFNQEGEDLFLQYNPYATAMLTTHLKDVRAIFGPVIIVPFEELEFANPAGTAHEPRKH